MNDLIKHTSAEDVDELAGCLPNVHRTLHLIPSNTETIVHTCNPTNSEGEERSSKTSLSPELYSNSEASLGYISAYLKIKCLAGCFMSCAMQVGMLPLSHTRVWRTKWGMSNIRMCWASRQCQKHCIQHSLKSPNKTKIMM